ncbi:MAG: hypothetical protein ACREPQ_14265 [Rhodanobacter sp.]
MEHSSQFTYCPQPDYARMARYQMADNRMGAYRMACLACVAFAIAYAALLFGTDFLATWIGDSRGRAFLAVLPFMMFAGGTVMSFAFSLTAELALPRDEIRLLSTDQMQRLAGLSQEHQQIAAATARWTAMGITITLSDFNACVAYAEMEDDRHRREGAMRQLSGGLHA